ncbi:MAG: hypothetical protein P8M11_01640 [Planctomycetota bacterium]|nr:hypothetical protein [Planctomycetota bacterium]MDG1983246.1 hypothetical protein [Planctomycetota bacterium]
MLPRILLYLLLGAGVLGASCASLAGPQSSGAGPTPPRLAIHVSYAPAFEALKEALEEDKLLLAQSTARQLRGRLSRDLESSLSLPEARGREDDVAALTLAGTLPSREAVEVALLAVERFEKIVGGRERLRAVALRLELRRLPAQEAVEVWLTGTSGWADPLLIRPFAASLLISRSHVDRKGFEVDWSESVVLDGSVELSLAPGGTAELLLEGLPIQVPVGAMATRMRVVLDCTGGELEEAGERFPAREVLVEEAERTDIAGWIPVGLLEPQLLGQLLEQGRGRTEILLECAIRITPSRRAEALDVLGRAVQTLPDEAVRPVIPAARWLLGLSGLEGFGRDERGWKEWLGERYDRRVEAGEIAGVSGGR